MELLLKTPRLLRTAHAVTKLMNMIPQRNIYKGRHVIYPSVEWFTDYHKHQSHYQEIINPMMKVEPLTIKEVEDVKGMLENQARILRTYGKVHLLNPLEQTLEQYLFGVPDILDVNDVKKALINLDLLSEDGSLNKGYDKGSLLSKEGNTNGLKNCAKYISAVDSALNGISSRAMDTLYFGNLWLHLGFSNKLHDRPIAILQSPKYHCRQIERYYGIIACMALGVTPVQIGNDSQGRPYYFEGMADVLPIKDKEGDPILICVQSSRTHKESYSNLEYIHRGLGIKEPFPKLLFVAEIQEKFKDMFFHQDLAIHADEDGNLYLGQDILEPKVEESLVRNLGANRVNYIPHDETMRYGLNTVLYDGRFGASSKVAITRDDCPVLKSELVKNGYEVYEMKEVFPHGGGGARCRLAILETGTPHTLESFLHEQRHIERRLGTGYAVVTSDQVEIFKDIFDPSHVQEIIHSSE